MCGSCVLHKVIVNERGQARCVFLALYDILLHDTFLCDGFLCV